MTFVHAVISYKCTAFDINIQLNNTPVFVLCDVVVTISLQNPLERRNTFKQLKKQTLFNKRGHASRHSFSDYTFMLIWVSSLETPRHVNIIRMQLKDKGTYVCFIICNRFTTKTNNKQFKL